MSCVTSAAKPVILALRSSTAAGEGGKYTLSITNSLKKLSSG
jgi:hypothetical protein